MSPEPTSLDVYSFAGFELDLATQQLRKDGEVVPLGVRPFDTLLTLVRNRHRVISKEELIKAVWPDAFVSDDSLTHTISAIRRALGDDAAQPRLIGTVARRGYRFIAPVTVQTPRQEDTAIPATPDALPAVDPRPAIDLTPPVVAATSRRSAWVWAAGGAAMAIVAIVAVQKLMPASSAASTTRPLRFTQSLPPGTTLASSGVLSPDGRHLAFVGRDGQTGRTQLWVRTLDGAEPRAIEGTDGARRPFWSPDGETIGYFAGSRVMKIDAAGGMAQTVTPTIGAGAGPGSWSSTGTILFSDAGAVFSVNAAGGKATRLLDADEAAGDVSLSAPQLLPDGRHFLFRVNSRNAERSGTWVGAVDSTERTRLLDASHQSVTYAPDGFLVFTRDSMLMAQPFNASALQTTGEARTVTGNISPNAAISASIDGLLTYGGGLTAERLTWFDRSGKELAPVNIPTLDSVMLAPNGRQLVGFSPDRTRAGLWLVDLERGVPTRLVPDGGGPLWSPDGSRIAFTATRAPGQRGIYVRSLTGNSEADVVVFANGQGKLLQDWSPDGRNLVFSVDTAQTKNDLWVLPLDGDRTPRRYLDSPAKEIQARISPNGRWMAYVSDESGTPEVYLQGFPEPGGQRVSLGAGAQPQWRGDGRELFYLAPGNVLTAVDVDTSGTLRAGTPRALFRAPLVGALIDVRNLYSAAPDGSRFLMKVVAPAADQEPITVLVHWPAFAQ